MKEKEDFERYKSQKHS